MLPETEKLFSEQHKQQALAFYGAEPGSVKDLGGFEAFVFEYQKDNRAYILKITHTVRRTVAYLMGEIEFVNYLGDNDVPLARVVPSENGRMVETVDDGRGGQFLIYAFEKIDGALSEPEDWTDSFVSEWGEIIGAMHRLTRQFEPSDMIYKRRQWFQDDIYNFDKYVPAQDTVTLKNCQAVRDKIKQYPTDKNSFGLIHGDLHHGNFFKNNDGRIVVFDFDDCEYHYLISDVTMPLYYTYLSMRKKGEKNLTGFAENFFARFMAGYKKNYRLDKFWFDKMDDFLMLRSAILFTIFNQVWPDYENDEKKKAMVDNHRNILSGASRMIDIDFVKLA